MTEQLVVIGPTRAVLRVMFPQADAHVVTWWRWRTLCGRGIVDRAGIVLVGRQRGQFWQDGARKERGE